MNILDILEGIEKFIVELLLWIVFIPKTLFKIIADPYWVPEYVEDELAKDSDRFNSYISPILLFLASSVVLFIFLEQLNFNLGILPNSKDFAAALQGERGVLAGLGFLSIPLMFSLAIELFRRKGITRSGILRILYMQCFYLSPITLSIFAFLIADSLLLDTILTAASITMFGLLIWFPIVEVNLIARELKTGILKSIGVFTACTIAILVGTFTFFLFSDEYTVVVDANYEGESEEVTDLSLPQSDKYTIAIWGFDDTAGDYQMKLSKANGSESTESNIQGDESDCLPVAGPINYGECGLGTVTVGIDSIWTFEGMEGDRINITVVPDNELDVGFEVLDTSGDPIRSSSGNTSVVEVGGYLYIMVVGFALVIGFRSLMRKPKKQENGSEGVPE